MTTINGRTPEEIKKGLECCADFDYFVCEDDCNYVEAHPYPRCRAILAKDALAYIQQLDHSWDELFETAKQLERERDAAVEDMTELMHLGKFCRHCKHLTEDGECTFDFAANKCAPWNCWQWRGVQEVE